MGVRLAVLAAALSALAGCAEPAQPEPQASPQPYACLLPGEQRMLVAELFFGRSIRGRRPLTDSEWAEFAAQIITPNFPAGFTVMDGEGQWQNPATHEITREPTKILLVAVPRAPDLAGRLSAIADAYKARFRQRSVGIVTRDSCASF
jgi:hypothetical protein